MGRSILQDPFLDIEKNVTTIQRRLERRSFDNDANKSRKNQIALIGSCMFLVLFGISGFLFREDLRRLQFSGQETELKEIDDNKPIVTSENGVVAADHETCSEIGANVLRLDKATAVDAAVAVAFCLGVVNPTSSGIGGGAFMVVGSTTNSIAKTYDMRETAPLGAFEDMFKGKEDNKTRGALSIAVPGEIAGLYKAWDDNGRNIEWKLLLEPAIKLARDSFKVGPHLEFALSDNTKKIMEDPGLKSVFTIENELMKRGDICKNLKLAKTLEVVAEKRMDGFYKGDVAKNLAADVAIAGGILTEEDLNKYEVSVTNAMVVEDVLGYKIQGMWPPSSGTTGFSMVMNILENYKGFKTWNEAIGVHRLIEAIKYMLAARMQLGDPKLVPDTYKYVKKMISKSIAKQIRNLISDDETYPPEHYGDKYKQLKDEGTSHFCIVDKDRNVVSMTTTVNFAFGSGFMSTSTGVILNNQMADFALPTEKPPGGIPANANYIAPRKRPLSSMMPIIITKDSELVGVIGASGGIFIIPAVIQVFLNHFILNMNPLEAVKSPRIYHKLEPNEVLYEDWTVYNGEHIEITEETREILKTKGHELKSTSKGATVQFVVQTKQKDSVKTLLTAVSDLRKGGKPAASDPLPLPVNVF